MNLFNLVKTEFNTAWNEVSRPMFPKNDSLDDVFYTELFNYFHSLKGKTIDTCNGESLFPLVDDSLYDRLTVVKATPQTLSEITISPNFQARKWRAA